MRWPRWRPASFRTQIALSTMALTAIGMVLVTLGLQVLLHQIVQRNVEKVLEDRADAVAAAIRASSGTGIVVPEGVLDPGVVVYDARGRRVAGLASPRVGDQLAELARTTRERTLDAGETDRLRAVPLRLGSGRAGVVVVSEPLAPYERAELYVLLTSLVVGLLVVVAVGLIARWVTARALAPVAVMAERARDWSEHDLARRFGLGPPANEISALGATLDVLLERVAMTIRAEQRLTAELAHELRTPLAAILGSADLALLRGGLTEDARIDLEQIAASSRVMAQTITTLLDLARNPDDTQRASTCRLADVVGVLTPLVPDHLVLEDRTGPGSVRLAAPRDLVVRALSPLVENAVRHAHSRVLLDVVETREAVEVHVGNDGPAVDDALRHSLFEPGSSGSDGGTGLGLGIARRVARSIGGEVEARASADGALYVVRLPHL
jgi:signal transduction histidine kinase